MTGTRRLASVLSLAAAAILLSAAPALAKPTPPPPPSPATSCPAQVQNPDGSVTFGVEANGAGCVVVRSTAQGVSLVEVVLAPDWSSQLKGGGNGRVDVQFGQAASGARVEVRVEPGKTEVK